GQSPPDRHDRSSPRRTAAHHVILPLRLPGPARRARAIAARGKRHPRDPISVAQPISGDKGEVTGGCSECCTIAAPCRGARMPSAGAVGAVANRLVTCRTLRFAPSDWLPLLLSSSMVEHAAVNRRVVG